MALSLEEVFNKFAGKEIQVTETDRGVQIAKSDKTVSELKKAIEEAGFRLRLWMPNSMGTCDFRTDRVNVHVGKGKDGKYRVGKKFNIG